MRQKRWRLFQLTEKRPGFTLIESLAVIAIIGVLLALGSYLFVQAQAQARDTGRKSDLDQIAQAFAARQLDRTCPDQAAVGLYPGESLETTQSNAWVKVSLLGGYSDGCGPFTQYLPTIPNDQRSPSFSYYFNLSTLQPSGATTVPAVAKHYRLTASLEHQFAANSPDQLECVRLSQVWLTSFGGKAYDCDQRSITQGKPPLLVSAANQNGAIGGNTIVNGGVGGGVAGVDGGGITNTSGPYNYYVGQ